MYFSVDLCFFFACDISTQKIISGENILNPKPIRFGNLSLHQSEKIFSIQRLFDLVVFPCIKFPSYKYAEDY